MSNDEGKSDEEIKPTEPQKPTGKRPTGLVASSKEDRGPWLGLAQLARNSGNILPADRLGRVGGRG